MADDHINLTLGRQSFHLNNLPAAMEYYGRLLRSSRQPPTQQDAFIKEFVHVCTQYSAIWGGELPRQQTAAPEFAPGNARLSSSRAESESQTLMGPDGSSADEGWIEMELAVVERGLNANGRVARPILVRTPAVETVGAVGEPLFVRMTVKNPLAVAISLYDVHAWCTFYSEDGEKAEPSADASEPMPSAIDCEILKNVYLDPGQETVLSVALVPRQEGRIAVWGLRYTLLGCLPAFHRFKSKVSRDCGDSVAYTPLKAKVMHPMPLLQIGFSGMSERMLSGEMKEAALEVTNQGSQTLTNLCVALSHPGFLSLGQPTKRILEPIPNGGFACAIDNTLEPGDIIRISDLLHQMGRHPSLEPGQTVRLPISLRGDKIGRNNLRFLFAYQSEVRPSHLKCSALHA